MEFTQQDFIKLECERWKYEGRWKNQKQAIAVAFSKFRKYLQSGYLDLETAERLKELKNGKN